MKPILAITTVLVSLALTACNSNPSQSDESAAKPTAKPAAKSADAAPQAKADPAPAVAAKAEARLDGGVKAYEDGDYKTARQELQGALDQGLGKPAQVKANKYLAFVACATGQRPACKAYFRKALALDPKFQLTKAEAGHPIWGPVFKEAKAEAGRKTAAPAKPGSK